MKKRVKQWRPLALFLLVMVLVTAQARPAQAMFSFSSPWMTPEQWAQKATPETGLTIFSEVRQVEYSQRTVYGLKDASGAVVVPADYTQFCYVDKNRIIAQKWWLEDGLYEHFSTGMLDASGNVVFPFREETVDIIPADWTGEPDGGNHTFLVETGITRGSGQDRFSSPSVGLYDWDLKELVSPYDASVTYLGDGAYRLADASALTQMSVVDADVEDTGIRYGLYRYGTGITIPMEYIELTPLGNDLYAVRRPDLYCGVLDGSGNQVLPFLFADVTDYHDGYFTAAIFRSPQDYENVKKMGFLFDPAGDTTWSLKGFDMSDVPSYAVYGVVDRNGTVVLGFDPEDEKAEFDEAGNAVVSAWKGDHGPVWPFGNSGSFSGLVITAKTYDEAIYSTPMLDLFLDIGLQETVSDLLAEHGLSVTGPQPTVPSTVGGFSDVAADAYYADAVVWAVDKGITSGTSGTTFSPDATCSTAEILTFLWRASGSPVPTIENPFSDVNTGSYYADAALWAYEKGLVSGTSFGGDAPATRLATVTYLWTLAGKPAPQGTNPFTDVSGDTQAIVWAVEQGITTGTGGSSFSPDVTCSRGQIVTFLHRDMGKDL